MSLKLFFLTTEIEPFASTSHLGKFSVDIPLALQTVEHDIRTIIPKYGFVSERKYILREVIRFPYPLPPQYTYKAATVRKRLIRSMTFALCKIYNYYGT